MPVENRKVEILYQEKEFVVCVKSPGMDSEHELPGALKQMLGGEIFPLHRLDANVGGVIVYARTRQAAAALSETIQSGAMGKEYVALVHGMPEETGDWEDLLWKDSKKNKVFVVERLRKGVKPARLEYKRLRTGALKNFCDTMESEEPISLVRVRLHTGRSHQIRVQFASRKYPLVGDHKYGARDKAETPMLFSCCVSFPYKGKMYRFEKLPRWAENV